MASINQEQKSYEAAQLKKLKTRWRRWLGQKTRWDKPYWTTLLSSNWLGWASSTLSKHGIDGRGPRLSATVPEIKAYYSQAIEVADFWDLMKLDNQYANDLINRR